MTVFTYYYRDAQGREIGPLPLSAIAQLRQAGVLTEDTPVRAENETGWQPCREVVAVTIAPSQPPSMPLTSPTRAPGSGAATVKKYSWSLFAVATLCFLLPFFEFSCQGKTLFAPTGLQLATGQDVDVQKNIVTGETERKSFSPQLNAGIALALAAAAALLALARRPITSLFGAVVAGVGVLQLLALRGDIVGEMLMAVDGLKAQQAMLQMVNVTAKEGYTAALACIAIGGAAQLWLWSQGRTTDHSGKGGGLRLTRGDRIAALGLLIMGTVFYGGPWLLQVTLNRHPPSESVRALARGKLPYALHVGDWCDVKSVEISYRREYNITDWQEDLTASGDWLAETTFVLHQKIDLFRPENFSKLARATHDDSAEFTNARLLADRFIWAKSLPPLPVEPQLFSRASAAGDEFTEKVKFRVSKRTSPWLGWSVQACWKRWSVLFTKDRDWDLWASVFASIVPPERSDSYLLRLRNNLPKDALVAGEEATVIAIKDFLAKRHEYVLAVEARAVAENLPRFQREVRRRLKDEVSRRFQPSSAYSAKQIDLRLPQASVAEKPVFDCVADVNVIAEDDVLIETSFATEAAILGDDFSAFEKAKEELAKFFPNQVDLSNLSRLIRRTIEKGNSRKTEATISVKRDGPFWDITNVAWAKDNPTNLPVGGTFTASQLKDSDLVVSSGSPQMEERLRTYVAQRKQFVQDVGRELSALESRWGPDRSAWEIVAKCIDVQGGMPAVNALRAYVGQSDGYLLAPNGVKTIISIKEWFRFPSLYRNEFTANGRTQIYAFSRGQGWTSNDSGRVDLLDKATLAEVDTGVFLEHMMLFLARTNGEKVQLSRAEDTLFAGRACHSIRVASSRCKDLMLFFDVQNASLAGVGYTGGDKEESKMEVQYYYGGDAKLHLLPQRSIFIKNGATTNEFMRRTFEAREDFGNEVVKNPLVGRPYTPDPSKRSNWAMTFFNNAAAKLSLYLDDNESPQVILGGNNAQISLPFGTHDLTAVADGPAGRPSSEQAIARCRLKVRMEGIPEPHYVYVSFVNGRIVITEKATYVEHVLTQ
jgi:hypothetical protein